MVVLLILGMLASIAAPQVVKRLGKAKSQTAAIQIEALAAGVDYFKIDVGTYPSNDQGLAALYANPGNLRHWDGPYVRKRASLTDPWGEPYQYRYPGERGPFDVYSLGADGKVGGDGENQDLGNW